jgi:hypothetical protein
LAEGADDGDGVLVLGVDGVIEAADVSGGELAGEIVKSGAKLGKLREGGLADDGDGVVRREVVAVVGESDEAERVNEAISGVASDNVDLMIDEGAVDEAEVHDFGRAGEVEIVAGSEAGETIGALEEFVANSGAPLGSKGCDVGNFLQPQFLRVVPADDHGESIFEAERLGDLEMESIGVALLDAVKDSGGITLRRFVQDGGERGAGVFDVEVEFAGEERLVDEKRATEVGFANDGDAGFGLDVLGEKFGEDDLLGEEFGADDDFGLRTLAAGEEKKCGEEEESKERAAHVRTLLACVRGGQGGSRQGVQARRRESRLRG